MGETSVRSLGLEDPWRRERLTTTVFWPRELHGLYSPWDHKESDTTEWLSLLSLCMKCSLGISDSLEEISSLSHSIVFLYFFALIIKEGFFTSPCYSLEHGIQMGICFLFSFAFSFSSQLFVRLPQNTILPFCISFSWQWSWSLPPVQCHKPLSIVLQALCLSDLIPWIYLSLLLYNHKGFDLGHTWMF